MSETGTWQEVVLEVCKLGGAVVVAIVALWLYVPAMNAQNERLMEAMKADREAVDRQVGGILDSLEKLREDLRKKEARN